MKNCYYHSGQEPSGKQRPYRSKEKPQEPPVPTPPPRGERGDRVGLRGRKQLFRWHWCKVSSHHFATLPDRGTNSKKDAQSPVSPSEEAASGVGKRTHTCFIALSARYLTNPSLESRTCRRATASSTCSVTQRLSATFEPSQNIGSHESRGSDARAKLLKFKNRGRRIR